MNWSEESYNSNNIYNIVIDGCCSKFPFSLVFDVRVDFSSTLPFQNSITKWWRRCLSTLFRLQSIKIYNIQSQWPLLYFLQTMGRILIVAELKMRGCFVQISFIYSIIFSCCNFQWKSNMILWKRICLSFAFVAWTIPHSRSNDRSRGRSTVG